MIAKLESWATDVASGHAGTPRILLLVGGPGNGKTEAIEHTIKCLDQRLFCEGKLIEKLSQDFHPSSGQAVPRVVQIDTGSLVLNGKQLRLDIVQDASVTAGNEGRDAPSLLIEELNDLLQASETNYYLCCVNRGVLDDALINAIDNRLDKASILLEAITRAVSLSATAPSCWPLAGFPAVAVWPMDAESLLVGMDNEAHSAAMALIRYATAPTEWLASGACPAGTSCPFCYSQTLLVRDEHRAALLQILRWYELASGKRWSFRDLFSLVSYLLAGHHPARDGHKGSPCDWAKYLVELDKQILLAKNPRKPALTAIFHLATSSYQQALFHRWEKNAANSLRQDLKDLSLEKNIEETRTLDGLTYFLQGRKDPYLPATISSLLEGLAEMLDPALASPDTEVAVSSRKKITLADLDTRFSRSLGDGLDFIRKHQVLAPNELELLKRLAKADLLLSMPLVRRKKPTAASRIQRMLRDFACRLVRRSICTRSAVVADAAILQSFQQVVEDQNGNKLYEVAKQVKDLLNDGQVFKVSLTTTFGQPLPPLQRQATLVVQPRQVRALPLMMTGRPLSPICFLQVGSGSSIQPIALTYDLYKAVKELERGLSPASLPRTVVALLDTTRARLSGPIVRDPEVLVDAQIHIGADGTEIGTSWNGFMAVTGKGSV
ncbi:hypothetical protein [Undibacterium sp.]|uniref:hypothetical protein n=1 Tax=Undibacterium sp. TaxID=1914977 RepID=UPI00272F20E1|nr:hypothetical protein [Undibacterium sp.]MDP1979398.1 hypothetical protein [Undibacterium sp.]